MLLRLVRRLPPEMAHRLGILALCRGLLPNPPSQHFPSLNLQALGLNFPTPLGLAAGFDKNAEVTDALLSQGFGFVEAGTVTPLAQSGNAKPRVFRLSQDQAVINRLGFNNYGLKPFVQRLQSRNKTAGIVGANLGKNRDSSDAIADYVSGFEAVYPYADYVTVNISSPNTQGLRNLQKGESLGPLLAALLTVRKKNMPSLGSVPLLVKVAPDLTREECRVIVELALAYGIDGLIVGNTTISRPATLKSESGKEQGGLSGRPLFDVSTALLQEFYRLSKGKLLLVGVGGISSGKDAYKKIRSGASLVQLYTALVYQGFAAIKAIETELAALLAQDGFSHISQAIGADIALYD